MRLKDWAEQQGIHYQTAWRWARAGKMPVPTIKTETGQYLVQVDVPAEPETGKAVGYARVSSHDQKADLERQAGRIALGAVGQKLSLDGVITEVGSGLNGNRPKLKKLLSDPDVKIIVVEHRERLARFGFEYIEAALQARGGRIVVLDDSEVEDDLVRDMTEVLTSFCARLYGRRGAKNRADKALKATQEVTEDA